MKYIDKEIAEILTLAFTKAEELEALLDEIRSRADATHGPMASFEIVFRYYDGRAGPGEEWFAISQWTGDHFEVVEGEDRVSQVELRTKK